MSRSELEKAWQHYYTLIFTALKNDTALATSIRHERAVLYADEACLKNIEVKKRLHLR